jgi:hypothetical protein
MKRILSFGFLGMLLASTYGCVALLAGAVGGAGTAAWLSGKLTQTFDKPYSETVEASRRALTALNLNITKVTEEEKITQFRGKYPDDKEFWVDVHRLDSGMSKVEVRVGAVEPDKDAASWIMKTIQDELT